MLFVSLPSIGQDIQNVDLTTINVDNLTDEQIQKFVTKAESSGMTQTQLEELARQRGMSELEIQKLRTRIYSLNPELAETQDGAGTSVSATRLREDPSSDPFQNRTIKRDTVKGQALKIFGMDFFEKRSKESNLSSSVNIPTPSTYVLGAGDEMIIDIFGASEITYRQEISPDGQIIISGIGPVSLAGLSLEVAQEKLKSRLSNIYSGLRGRNPNTFMQVSLGDIRTINVNVIGQVTYPGTYSLHSFSNVLNALYAAGGPSKQGTLRNIRLIRDAKTIGIFDFYTFLFAPETTQSLRLQDGDNVIVDPFVNRVSLSGAVKTPAKFEMLPGETLDKLIAYAGGFAENAFTASVLIERSNEKMKSVVSVARSQFKNQELQNGDSINVEQIINRFENRVAITGAIFRPGYYELTDGMLLSDLLKKAEGLREDAFKERANIFRLNSDLSSKNISFNVQNVLEGKEDIVLNRDDQVIVQSIFDLRVAQNIQIKGEVQKPGIYPYLDSMTVEDIVTQAGGFKESANRSVVEVARQLGSESGEITRTAEIFTFEINDELGLDAKASDFILEPFDVVLIKRSSFFHSQEIVKIEGEVLYPGYYALESREDKISDLISRAGGLTDFAYIEGATILRRTEYFEGEISSIGFNELEAENYRSKQLKELQQRDTGEELTKLGDKEGIGIDLGASIQNPGSKHDLILKDGDVISVPKQLQTVRVRGNVLYPNTLRYEQGMSAKRAISQAGGFTDDARPSKAYVIYANGSAERTRSFFWIKKYPKLRPGAEVIVPQRIRERQPLNAQQLIGITSSLATLVLVITQINN